MCVISYTYPATCSLKGHCSSSIMFELSFYCPRPIRRGGAPRSPFSLEGDVCVIFYFLFCYMRPGGLWQQFEAVAVCFSQIASSRLRPT